MFDIASISLLIINFKVISLRAARHVQNIASEAQNFCWYRHTMVVLGLGRWAI